MTTCCFSEWNFLNFAVGVGILFSVFSLSSCLEPSWLISPEDTTSRVGETVTLQCRVEQRDSRDVAWQKFSGDVVHHLFINSNPWVDDERLVITEFDDGYDLTIKDISKYDDGEYECVLSRSSVRKKVYLTVLVPPQKPEISINNTATLREGSTVEINCTSMGGNPAPTIAWLRNDVKLTTNNYLLPKERFGMTSSSISRELDHSDHTANYSCVVENEVSSGDNKIVSKVLTVQYAPIVTVGEFNPYQVVEKSDVSVKCSVSAYPEITQEDVYWTNEDEFEREGFVLSISSIEKEDAGYYSCAASNVLGNGLQNLQIDVLYAPIVTIISDNYPIPNNTISLKEGQNLYLTCNVDSNPASDGFVRWYYNGEQMGPSSVDFISKSISRSQKGTYSCEAENILQPSGQLESSRSTTSSVDVIVYYKPGDAKLSGPRYALQGSTVTLTCSVDDEGLPKGEIIWSRIHSFEKFESGDTITLYNVQSSHEGQFKCFFRNAVGDGIPATFSLNIYEEPSWIPGGELKTVRTVLITQTNIFVMCSARGRPLPKIRWFKNKTEIYDDKLLYEIHEEHRTIDSKSFLLSSTLFWRGASRYPRSDTLQHGDGGFYTCIAENEVSTENISSTVNLIIHYPPVINTNNSKIAVDIGHSAHLVCEAHCKPKCLFSWYNGTTMILPTSGVNIESFHDNSRKYPYQSFLIINKVSLYDLKPYMCFVSNKMGSDTFDLELIPKTTPEKPNNLRVLERTWESINLQWNPGFDGGHKQWFSITYFYDDRSSRLIRLKAGTHSFNITDLVPGTNYTFVIFSSNMLGPSKHSDRINAFTKAFLMDSPREVYYHKDERTLTFQSRGTNYCVHVETYHNGDWYLYEKCAPASGGSIKIHERLVENVRVSLCQVSRKEICSHFVEAFIVNTPQDEVGFLTILIVAGACCIVVLILVIILIVVCYKRKKIKDSNDKDIRSNVYPTMQPQEFERKNPPGSLFVYDLKTMERANLYEKQCRVSPNPWCREFPPSYNDIEKKMNFSFHNSSTGDIPRSDSPIQRGSNRSTPDIQRPRKVVYEVVV